MCCHHSFDRADIGALLVGSEAHVNLASLVIQPAVLVVTGARAESAVLTPRLLHMLLCWFSSALMTCALSF